MKIYDRLYGELKFPPIILDLLNCPGLLRLRDVRMANNQFVAFPAFASASRYEHSLGVCHLAGICASSLGLSEKDTLELMIASLYHDVGTPPFAHAMEEVLQAKFGFDHEQHLKNLIWGTNEDLLGNLARVFCDEGLKVRSVCHSKKGRAIGLDLYRIAKIAAGDKDEPLAPLLNGNGMDLDNIDNIIRASSAMGLIPPSDIGLSERLAHAFVLEDNKIYYDGNYMNEIRRWQAIRDVQYTAIFESIDDFSYQTMLKKALNLLLDDNTNSSNSFISKDSWNLTDSSIVYDILLQNSKTQEIMKRVMLCRPYYCLGVIYIQGAGVLKYINLHLDDVEQIATEYFISALGLNADEENYAEKKKRIREQKINTIYTNAVVANYYPDKRKRALKSKAIAWNSEMTIDQAEDTPQGALLGLFTPFSNSNYKTVTNEDGSTTRKVVTFRENNLQELITILKNGVLKEFEVSIYGSDTKRKSSGGIEKYQLELF